MAATLRDIMLAPDVQPKVIDDGLALVDEQISDKSGISGTAVKLAYKSVVSFSPGHIRYMIEQLIPGVHSRGAGTWRQLMAGSGGSQGFPSIAPRMASSAAAPWAAAESR